MHILRHGGIERRQGPHRDVLGKEIIEKIDHTAMPLQIGGGPAGMGGGHNGMICSGQFALQLVCKVEIGNLAVAIGFPGGIFALFPGQVVKINIPTSMGGAADVDDAAAGCVPEQIKEQAGQGEVPEVVGAELQLKAVGGLAIRRNHHPGVVDQQIQPGVRLLKLHRELAHRGEVGQIEQHHRNVGSGIFAADLCCGLLTLLPIAHRDDHGGVLIRQHPGGFVTNPAVGPGDERYPAMLVGYISAIPFMLCHLPFLHFGYCDRSY